MDPLSNAEALIVAHLKEALGSHVKQVAPLEGTWDDDQTLRRILVKIPGVFVSFQGGPFPKRTSREPELDSRWTIYAVTGHAQGADARRLGDGRQLGTMALTSHIVQALHHHTFKGVGTCHAGAIDEFATGKMRGQRISVYAVTIRLPITLSAGVDVSALSDFETFEATYSTEGATVASDLVTLETA